MNDETPPPLEPAKPQKSQPEEKMEEVERDHQEGQHKEKKVVVDTSNMPENGPIKYGIMNSPEIPIDKNEESLYFTSLRIGEIKGLEGCTNCKVSWPAFANLSRDFPFSS